MMRHLRLTVVTMAMVMVAASVFAVVLRPTKKLADVGAKMDLEMIVPKQFGQWRIDASIIPLTPSPDVQAKLDKIYNQTLARTYVNDQGQRIMLSIAYGGDQSDALQVHLPEVCYAAQGFDVKKTEEGEIVVAERVVPVRRVLATLGARIEPITYWIKVGDLIVNSGTRRKLAQLKYGLVGNVPDGILVRVSSIGRDAVTQYQVHTKFLDELVAAMPPTDRTRVAGSLGT